MPKSDKPFAVERRRTMRNARPPKHTNARPAAAYRGAIRNAWRDQIRTSKQAEKTDTIAPEE